MESNSEVDAGVFVERSSKLKSKSGKLNEIMEEIEGNEGSEAVSKSEISFVEQVSDGILNFSDGNVKANSKFNENEVASVASAAKLAEEATEQVENRASEFSFPWESERDFKFVLDWKIYVICNFAHFRSRWIKNWQWYLNSHDLINTFFYLSSVWLPREVGRKENLQVLVPVFLCFEGKVN